MRRTKTTVLALVAMLTAAAAASAQFGFGWDRPTEYYESQVRVASSRTAEELLARAKKDMADGEWERCVRLVQEAIDNHGAAALVADDGHFVGVRAWCLAFLESLPEEGLRTYRTVFDPYAAGLHDRGIATHDPQALKEVVLRYAATSYGASALNAAISLALEQGRFHDAWGLGLLHLESFPRAVEARAAVVAQMALAARMLGTGDELATLRERLDEALLEREIAWGGEARELGALLDELAAAGASAGASSREAPPVSLRFFRADWWAKFGLQSWGTSSPTEVDDFGDSAPSRDFSWNPVLPVLDESAVYLSNGVTIRAIELFRATERWSFAGPVGKSQARVDLASTFPLVLDRNVVYGALETPVERETRIWNYVPQMAIPERRLHAIDAGRGTLIWSHADYRHRDASDEERELVEGLSITSRPLIRGDDLFVSGSRFHTSYDQYVCCFDRRTGRLRWSTFICTGQMEQNMFGNRVRECVTGELVAKDGALWYSTNLGVIAAVDMRLGTLAHVVPYEQVKIPRQNRANRMILERGPNWQNNPPVVLENEILFTPMDSRQLVAVDVRDGSSRVVLERDARNRFRYVVGPAAGRVAIVGSSIAFYDVATATVLDTSISLTRDLSAREQRGAGIVGRPVVLGNRLYAPARHRGGTRALQDSVLVWDMIELRVLNEFQLGDQPGDPVSAGNLATNGDAFVIAATDPGREVANVRCYFDRDDLLRRLRAATTERPEDPSVWYQLGELALQGAKPDYRGAIESFEKALDTARQDPAAFSWRDRARTALHRLHLDVAKLPAAELAALGLDEEAAFEKALATAADDVERVDILFRLMKSAYDRIAWDDFARHRDRLLAEHADTPYDHRELLRPALPELAIDTRQARAAPVALLLSARLAERLGRFERAVDDHQRVIAEWPQARIGRDDAWTISWRNIAAIIEKHGRATYARHEKEARRLLDEASRADGAIATRRLLDLYPNAEVVPDAYAALARRHLGNGRPREAVLAAQEFLARFGRPNGSVLVIMARALEQLGLTESAADTWRYAADVAPRDPVEEGDGVVVAGELAQAALAQLPPAPSRSAPAIGLELEEAWSRGDPAEHARWDLVRVAGVRPERWSQHVLAHRGESLSFFGAASAEPLWTIPAAAPPFDRAHWRDGMLVLAFWDEALVIDPADGREIWRITIPEQQIAQIAVGQAAVQLALRPHSHSQTFSVQSRSLIDGTLLWEKSFAGEPHPVGFTGDRWLAIPLANEPRCHVLDGFTGSPAPAYPDGVVHEGALPPFLNRRGELIAATASSDGQRSLQAIVLATGAPRWTRRLGDGDVKVLTTAADFVVYALRNGVTDRSTIVVVDVVDGVTAMQRELEPGVTVSYDVAIDDGDVFAVCMQFRDRQPSIFVECFELESGASRWRSASFRAALVSATPFREGVAIAAVEQIFRTRRAAARETTVHLVDRETGRAVDKIDLPQGEPMRGNLIAVEGALFLADGPVLRVHR